MLKIISTATRRVLGLIEPRAEPPADEGAWLADPLSHPVLARMDARELADLPFPRAIFRGAIDAGTACLKPVNGATRAT